jgi:hypothetical protein
MAMKHYKNGPFDDFIALTNLLPPNAALPEPSALDAENEHKGMLDALYHAFNEQFLFRNFLPERMSGFPLRGTDGTRTLQFRSGAELYPGFHAVRAALSALIAAAGSKAPFRRSKEPPGRLSATRLRTVSLPVVVPTRPIVLIGPDGTARVAIVDPTHDLYREFLKRVEGADVSRLKRCPVCKRPFWARRRDQVACEPGHANRYRVWQHRMRQTRVAGVKIGSAERVKKHKGKRRHHDE